MSRLAEIPSSSKANNFLDKSLDAVESARNVPERTKSFGGKVIRLVKRLAETVLPTSR